MPLNDLIKEYSLTTISQKTNIPIGVLENLVNKEWEKLQATKAKGFIAIIEREFNIDLSSLKEEANEYYKTHQKQEPQTPIDLVDAQTISNSSKIITNIVALIALILVIYAIWFYFFKPKSTQTTPQETNSSGLITQSLNKAKSLISIVSGSKEDNKKNILSKEKNSTQTKPATPKEEPKEEIKEEPKKDDKKPNETKVENKKFDITTDVKKDEELTSNNQLNSNDNNTTAQNTKDETNQQNIEENKTINQEINSLLEENITKSVDNNTTNSSEISETNITNIETNMTNNDSNISALSANNITIKPTVKTIWVGIYNLKNFKRTPKLFSGEFTYKSNGDDIAIVTGHSKFEITTDNGFSKKFNGKGRKYLYISADGIKELTKTEYRALTQNRAW